jgi:hypothetical protein
MVIKTFLQASFYEHPPSAISLLTKDTLMLVSCFWGEGAL